MKRAAVVACAVFTACASSRSHFEAGQQSAMARDWEAAVAHYEAALREEPVNVEYRIALLRARLEASHTTKPRSEEETEKLISTDPVVDPPSDILIQLSFTDETSLRAILETLAKLAGANIVFDEAYRDRTVRVELKGVTFEEALELLLETNGLFYKVIDSTFQVAPAR